MPEPLSLHEYLSSLSKDELIRLIERETLFNASFAKSMQKLLPRGKPAVLQESKQENRPQVQNEAPLERKLERMFPPVTKSSGVPEKIALFRSLFCSRTDVFALRWHNTKTGASGYSPVCKNKWASGTCNMKQVPCSQCPNRDMAELTDTYLFNHLAGKDPLCRDIVGMYALRPDETCCFLALDFDEENWKADIRAVRTVCSQNGLPCAVEISRSGNGAHVWFFFTEPVPAKLARELGSAVLHATMCGRHAMPFSSFDRMFPNQRTMPKGGYGNLIALPLQGQAVRQGHSVFVNDDLTPYPDQWGFLSSCRKLTKDDLQPLISSLQRKYQIDPPPESPAEAEIARQKPVKSSLEVLSKSDFGTEVQIVLNSQLHVMKNGISERALGAFRRTAVFQNPEYYQAERMRLPLWNKPRYIDCSAENKDELVLPRGSADRILSLLEELDVFCTVSDRRSTGIKQGFSFEGELREDQQEAMSALLEHNTGVLSAGTGFGKTVTATALIARRNTSTLILVHTHALLEQWKNAVMRFLKVEAGTIAAGKDKSTGVIDIALLQSLTDTDKETGETVVKPLPHEYGMVVVDECHHVSAFNFERVLKSIPARCVYGLTATPVRRDGHQPIIFMQCGPVRYATDMKSMTEQQNFYRHLIPRFTAFKPVGEPDESLSIARIYQELTENETRNCMIATDVAEAIKQGRTPLVLSERVSHISALAQKLKDTARNVIVITGRGTQKQKRELLEKLDAVPTDESLVVLATGKYIGEGFDLPRLDTLFLAMPFSWKGTLSQYCGRLHRNYEGKDEVQIYDYIDFRVPMLEKMHQKRLKGYKQLGYTVKPQSEDADGNGSKQGMSQEGTLFSADDYRQPFLSDCTSSQRQVFISSPYLSKAVVQETLPFFQPLVGRGVQVSVMTREAPAGNTAAIDKNKALIKLLEMAGITVTQKEGLSQRIAVIDEQILWYGSANLLGYAEEDDCFMQIISPAIATSIMVELERK